MFIYADPQACPGCRSTLPAPGPSCAVCGLDLTGPAPHEVFQTLRQVDAQVARLYAAASPTTPGPAATSAPPAQAPLVLTSASVPRILLGLGALCLLVAALVFLAVAWAALGVGGRTAVLGAFTTVVAGLSTWVARRGLRAGAEALAAVALGLVALDVVGARRAGWLGVVADDELLIVAGLIVAAAAIAVARWAATTPVQTLVGAQVIATIGLLAAAVGIPGTIDHGNAVAALVGVGMFGLATGAAQRLRLDVLMIGAAAGTAGSWLLLVGVGVVRLDVLTVARVWGDLTGWPILVATLLVAAPACVPTLRPELRRLAGAIAVCLGTLLVTVVAFDESATVIAATELAVIAAYALAAPRLPGTWKWLCIAPSAFAALGLAASVARLAVVATLALVVNEPWTQGWLERLDAPDVPWTWPLLFPAGVAGMVACGATFLHCTGRRPWTLLLPGTAATLVALSLVPALYGAPLVVAVVAVLVATGALAVGATASNRIDLPVLGALTAALTLLSALASDWLTAAVLAVFTAAAVAAQVRGVRAPMRAQVAGVFLAPLTGAGLIWTVEHLADVDRVWRALPVLLVLAGAMLVRPVLEREVSAGAAASIAVVGSVLGTSPIDQTWLATYLTIAGVIVTASSQLHAERRNVAWLGLTLLTMAQWTRLQEIGVGTVEAYTLPLALVLLAVGARALLRGGRSSTSTLMPGLGLALVPTLLQVLVDPVGLRAILLGLACVLLVTIGIARGWAAPLLAGAMVGALVVLRQATLAEVLPQWALIGLVGLGLTVVGVTWEQRLVEIRRVSTYVRGLR